MSLTWRVQFGGCFWFWENVWTSDIKGSIFFFLWRCDPTLVMASSFLRFLVPTQRRTAIGRTPLGEWSARRRDLYLTTHNNHNRQTSMPPVGFEPTISAGELPQTYALDRAATGTGIRGSNRRWNLNNPLTSAYIRPIKCGWDRWGL